MSDAVWLAIIGAIAMVVKEYFDHNRSKSVEKKVDANTAITAAGTIAAASNAEAAVQAANAAASKTDEISERLNGKLEQKMTDIVKEQMEPIHGKVEKLTEYVHMRNHKIDTDLQTVANKLESVRIMVERQSEKK